MIQKFLQQTLLSLITIVEIQVFDFEMLLQEIFMDKLNSESKS